MGSEKFFVTALDHLLEEIEAEFALERELGVRFVECDRSLLSQPPLPTPQPTLPTPQPTLPTPQHPIPNPQPPAHNSYDFVFLHDRSLSSDAVAMMAKIIAGLRRTAETAPILIEGPLPQARAYVVLGSSALHKWFTGLRAAPGTWTEYRGVKGIFVTYSPERILEKVRAFGADSPLVSKIKHDMWRGLKGVRDRLV